MAFNEALKHAQDISIIYTRMVENGRHILSFLPYRDYLNFNDLIYQNVVQSLGISWDKLKVTPVSYL